MDRRVVAGIAGRVRPLVLMIALAALVVGSAAAQTTLRCESKDGRRHQCGFEEGLSVRLARQLSLTDCVEGRNWGVVGNRVWVDNGCRADFNLFDRGRDHDRGRGDWDHGDRPREPRVTTVLCESRDGHRRRCEADTMGREITVKRQLSRNTCIEGQNWGRDPRGIWVDNGCRAEFLLVERGRDRDHDHGPPVTETIVCEAGNGSRNFCAADTRNGVQIRRDLSHGRCELNRTWGFDERGIWVSNGCRAEFTVTTRR